MDVKPECHGPVNPGPLGCGLPLHCASRQARHQLDTLQDASFTREISLPDNASGPWPQTSRFRARIQRNIARVRGGLRSTSIVAACIMEHRTAHAMSSEPVPTKDDSPLRDATA